MKEKTNIETQTHEIEKEESALRRFGTALRRAIEERRASSPAITISEPLASPKIGMKLYFVPGTKIHLEPIVLAFQAWRDERSLDEGELVDVATHAYGPWIMLVGTHAQWVIDGAEGRPGLRWVKRRHARPLGTSDEVLASALGALLAGAMRLERDAGLRFVTDELELEIGDLRRAPNVRDTFHAIAPELRRFALQLFEGPELEPTSAADPEGPFRARILASTRTTLAELDARRAKLGHVVRG